MANTKQGIYYQDDYSLVADVPSDMKKMAESIDTELETDRGRLSTTENNIQSLQSGNTTNKQDISNIKTEQTTQNTNIETLTQRLNEKDNQIAELKAENEDLKADLSNSQIHGQASGEYVHLVDSAKMNCEIAVLGNSKQETETDIMDNTWEQGDIDSTSGKTGTSSNAVRVKNYIHVISNVEYRISRTIATSYMSFRFYDKDYNYLGTQSVDGMISTDLTNATKNMQAGVYNQTMTILNTDVAYMKIVDFSNSLNTVYKIKADAINLNYPSEIESVSSANVKVCNKNVANEFEYLSTKKQYTPLAFAGYYFEKDKNYKISFDTQNTGLEVYLQSASEKTNYSSKYQYCKLDGERHSFVVTALETKYTRPVNGIILRKSATSDVETGLISNLMISEYDDTDDYIAHEEQNYTVDMQEPMLEGDYFNLESEKEVHNWQILELTGNEKINLITNQRFQINLINANLPTAINAYTKINAKSNYFNGAALSASNVDNMIAVNYDSLYMRVSESTTLEELTTFLKSCYDSNKAVKVYYKLAEPRKLDLTENQKAQLQALQKAKTYKNITNITTDTIAVLDVDYKRDLETIINNMQAQILAE